MGDGRYPVLSIVAVLCLVFLAVLHGPAPGEAAPPDTVITGGPSGAVASTSATFTFTSTVAGSTFQCSRDGAAFAACPTPVGYTALAQGSHTFSVRAIDPVGNVDPSPATRTWLVDTVAPITTITSGPTGTVASTTAAFTFTSNEAGSTFQCKVDSAAFNSCPISYVGLSQGIHSFSVRAIDPAGNIGVEAIRGWNVDTVAPDTSITDGPSGAVPSTSATFTFNTTKPGGGSTFQCRLDGVAFGACSTPTSYTGLTQGSHTFSVRAIDAFGNVDATPASQTWIVDTVAPETTITAGPSGAVASTSAAFTFTSTEAGSTFRCSRDGGNFVTCPASYTGLAQGPHTFAVRATDAAGNTDASPATRTWTVDSVAPSTTITDGPIDTVASRLARFTFTSTEPNSTFECSLDVKTFGACPVSYTGLADGPHTFQVRATDTAGNVGTPATRKWAIDTVLPDTVISSGPSGAVASTSATFSFVSRDPMNGPLKGPSTFECRLDGAPFGACPASYAGLAQGPHTFSVRAIDDAGNVDPTPATRTWTVDTIPPDTTITSGPSGTVASTSATFTFTSTEAGSTFQCRLDAAAFGACPASYSGLAQGSHTFAVRAVDAAGNVDGTPAIREWTVDTVAPETTITAGPSGAVASTSAVFTFTSSAPGGPGSTFHCSLDGAPFAACPAGYTGLAQGTHTFAVRAVDAVGNADPTPATRTWTVDTIAPSTTIASGPTGTVASTSAIFTFTSSDAGSTFECSLDGAPFGACPVSYTGLAQGPHTFAVRAKDPAGNSDQTPATRSWTVDTIAPETTITSGPSGTVTTTTAIFTFASSEAGSTFQCSLDGAPFGACAASYSGLAQGPHTFRVRATDTVGNTDATPAVRTWTVVPNVPVNVNAYWKELGGSATGGGVSQLVPPRAAGNGIDVAAGDDGRPILIYTVSSFTSEERRIVAKRWTGAAWQLISPATGINDPALGGEFPQIVISPAGTVYAAWLSPPPISQVHLRRRVGTSTMWEQLDGSDAPGGLTAINGSNVSSFSLAVGDDDLPVVAFAVPSQNPGVLPPAEGIVTGSTQIYVTKYMGGLLGWQYLGSDPFGTGGTSAGGASEATSLVVDGNKYARHNAFAASLVIDSEGRPVVAFTYATSYPLGGSPPEYAPNNTEIFVTRFENGRWVAVGPAVPSSDTTAGRGGAGGVSNEPLFSQSPSLVASPSGELWIAWRAVGPNNQSAIFVRRWNGATWAEVGGASASNGGIAGQGLHGAPRIGVDSHALPIVAWRNADADAVVFAVRFDGTHWVEMGPDSAMGDGVTGPGVVQLSLGVSSGAAPSTVNVAWLGFMNGVAQARLRQFFNGPSFLLGVGIVPSGSGQVTSSPIGIECPGDSCSELYPSGQVVSLTAIANADTIFDRWTGACTGSGACNVTMTAARSVNASFVSAGTLTVTRTGLGTVTGTGIACGTDCDQKYKNGTMVTLTATVPVGTIFGGWGGACAFRGTNTTCALTIQGATAVSAAFHQRVYSLRVAVGTPPGTVSQGGVGRVDGAGGGADPLACGPGASGICTAAVEHGARVVLSAVAAPGNRFLSWLGAPCAGRTNATCDFPMVANYSITAQFRGVTAIGVVKSGNGAGVVTGPLITCGTDCVGEAFTNTSVTMRATPALGSAIEPNGGVCTWATGVCTFTAAGLNQTMLATFTLRRYVLNVTGEGLGSTTSADGGIDCGSGLHTDCSHAYDHGTLVALTPLAGVDSLFVSWTGCSRVTGAVCFVDMTANRTVRQKFVSARTLELSASGFGHGRLVVAGQPSLLCTTACASPFVLPSNLTAVVTATPDVGSNFRWVTGTIGACIGKSTPCAVPMSANQSLIGSFSLNRHSITVTNRANGRVESNFSPDPLANIICGSGFSQCALDRAYGTSVRLQATANVGNVFVNWTGTSPCSVGAQATNPLCAFALKGNVTVTPNFSARTVVTVVKDGDGTGTITGPGISCGSDCTEPIFDGKRITLTATAAVGSRFGVWSAGPCAGSNTSTCSFVPAGEQMTATAQFDRLPVTLTINAKGPGAVTGAASSCSGDICTYQRLYGDQVVLQAVADPGGRFVSWTGCTSLTGTSCTVLLNGNRTVTATFLQE